MSSNQPLVSIIMPAYNAEPFIGQAIDSVLNQSYRNWELLIVNDGSEDSTEKVIQQFKDSRIRTFIQKNRGVSSARNLGLREMKGDFFCFLDADDALTEASLESRIKHFLVHPDVYFVDGTIVLKDKDLKHKQGIRHMSFSGNPRNALIHLDDSCFFGPSWMIRRSCDIDYQFNTQMTHAEDLLFFFSISEKGEYAAIDDEILHYRLSGDSAMSNLQGIENGYASFYREVQKSEEVDTTSLRYLKKRITRIMLLTYLRKLRFLDALSMLIRYTRL